MTQINRDERITAISLLFSNPERAKILLQATTDDDGRVKLKRKFISLQELEVVLKHSLVARD